VSAGRPTGPALAPLPPAGPAVSPSDLRERRSRLAEELAELQWDLGGLTYEMAIRDHFRLDVLVHKAARLQQVDAELGEVERLARLEDGGAGGFCPGCDALHSRGASFCWRCGIELMGAAEPQAQGATTPGPAADSADAPVAHAPGAGGAGSADTQALTPAEEPPTRS